jgi:ferric-dicitrate binding protein FerR (iron transport regulator)
MDQIEILITKWLSGNATAEEEKTVIDWANSSEANKAVLNDSVNAWKISLRGIKTIDTDVNTAWEEFKILAEKQAPRKTISILQMAAAVMLLICSGFLVKFFVFPAPLQNTPLAITGAHSDTVKELSSVQTADSQLLQPVAVAESLNIHSKKPARRNSMIAINSGDSALVFVLPDGSRVFLNKNSKLTYPEKFAGNERIVNLSGEAFFEVTRNKGEFIVICRDTRTRVLGTSFNVKGYEPNKPVQVIVETGLVEVSNTDGKNIRAQLLLKPGDNGIFNPALNTAVKSKCSKKDKWWKRTSFRSRIKHLINKITGRTIK